ncbi:MAG: acyltransferase domain-containing protein [Acidobacteriota bacterium]|nr:acyltransferase domain-containing protein [Acidobacteriota bacterium]
MTRIAIIGMACEFPGASTPERLWENVLARRRSFCLRPGDDSKGVSQAAVIQDYRFDRKGYEIDEATYRAADPALWLALDVSARALEDAGYPSGEGLPRDRTEVFFASPTNEPIARHIGSYFQLNTALETEWECDEVSLQPICRACDLLADKSLDTVIAGGVDLDLDARSSDASGASGFGPARIYDSEATGFIPGVGCGVVILKRLKDALAANDRIDGVISGWGTADDAESGSSLLPAMEAAFRQAGLRGADIDYFEGHGAGAGSDAAELRGIVRARQGAEYPADLGSIKANIGHTGAASGSAALIKAASILKHRITPPTTGCESPHPLLVQFGDVIRTVDRGGLPSDDRPLRVGVCETAPRGAGAHLVLEGPETEPRAPLNKNECRMLGPVPKSEFLAVSAQTRGGLISRLRELAGRVRIATNADLTDMAARLASSSPELWRAVVMARNPQKAAMGLEQLADEASRGETWIDSKHGLFFGRALQNPKPGFLFSGQGSPVQPNPGFLGARYAWVRELYQDHLLEDIAHEAVHAQTAVVLASYTGLNLLRQFGVTADHLIGHSLGELTALHEAGAIDEDQLFSLTRIRAYCMARYGESGGMISVSATADRVARPAAKHHTVIACYNGPDQTIISGTSEDLDALTTELKGKGMKVKRLNVTHGFHSPLLHDARAEFGERLGSMTFSSPKKKVYSTVTGGLLEPDAFLVGLLTHQFTAPVRFRQAFVEADAEVDLWLEVGPGSVFARRARVMTVKPVIATDIGSNFRGFLSALAACFVMGLPVNLPALYADRFYRPIDLDHRPQLLPNIAYNSSEPGITESKERVS